MTALLNYMFHGTPELFMHFWVEGDPMKVTDGLKSALAEVKKYP